MEPESLESLSERVAQLERSVGLLIDIQAKRTNKKDWRKTIGMFSDDDVMKEIFDLGQEIRKADGQDNSE